MPASDETYMFPTSKKEVEKLGWDYIDVIIFTGDAFIDHPSFGTAVIARILQSAGYRVAVVPQPNWQDDLRDFKKLGAPKLFFGVTSGAMDSMVNHYTANKRLRSNDAYTPGGMAHHRPDYAVTVYTKIIKSLFPDVPVVLGGIEASLRRLAHYDYWQDRLKPSVLMESGADLLVYGMGERQILAVADALKTGKSLDTIPQTAFFVQNDFPCSEDEDFIVLKSFEEASHNRKVFAENFNVIETEANKLHSKIIVEPYENGYIRVNPPYPPATMQEMDSYYALPYTKLPHPRYRGKTIPAFEMIKNSITIHRGCFGGCSFCTIAAHQGKFIQSRSEESIVGEVERLVRHPGFKGVISDMGAPTANMYRLGGKDKTICEKCVRKSCLFPHPCPNLDRSSGHLLSLYSKIDAVGGVKRSFVGSGIRYDLFLDEKGFIDGNARRYFEELVEKHTSGWFKVAPEHTEDRVLELMCKPSFSLFAVLKREFDRLIRKKHLKYRIVPYFISGHPGCGLKDMEALSRRVELKGISLEQVQDFTPTPMTASSVMYYSGIDSHTMKPVFVERNQNAKRKQKSLFYKK